MIRLHPHPAVFALSLLGLPGCSGHLMDLAGRYGQDETAAAGELAPMGGLAYRLCRKEAAYAFADNVFYHPDFAHTPSWPVWYGSQPQSETPSATRGINPVTWQQYCDESARAEDVIHRVARSVGAHGRALAAVAGHKPLDTAGIQSLAGDVGTVSSQLGGDGKVSDAARNAGSALSTALQKLVALYAEHKLAEIVAGSDGCLDQTFTHLEQFAEALQQRLRHTNDNRNLLLRSIALRPSPAFDRALVITEAIEVAAEDDRELRKMQQAIGDYRTAIADLAASQKALSALATKSGDEAAVTAALDKLEASIQALNEREQ
jgi:hypothetical protein